MATPTTINFDLSTQLETTLSQPGVYAYAFAFGTVGGFYGQKVATATLVYDGQTGGSGQAATQSFITLNDGLTNGAIYVVIQQGGDGTLPSTITAVGDINTTNSAPAPGGSNYSYQLFEVSLDGNSGDLGDISALNTFGFGATMEVVFQDSTTVSRGYRSSADTIFTALGSAVSGVVEPFSPNSFGTPNDRLAIGPASEFPDFPANDWTNYVNALKNTPAVLNDIVIATTFSGGTSLQATPMLSHYGVEYEASSDSFWLVPNLKHGATNTDWINITAQQLIDNIYTQSGNLSVYQATKTGLNVTVDGASFTPNNAAGTVSRDFIAGFDAGYWGGSGTSPNPLVTTPIDLNQNNNWHVNYAYNGTLNPGLVTTTNVLGSGPGTSGGMNRFYDPWAQAIQNSGNSYGWSYSDLVSVGGVNPQITLWDTSAGPINPDTGLPVGEQVSTINIGLYDNSEVPGSFQTAPPVYVPPLNGVYLASLTSPTFSAPFGYGNQIGFNFSFGVAALNFAPYLDTPINFKFYAPGSPQAGTDDFISLAVTSPNGNWYNYNVVENSGTWSLSPTTAQTTAGAFALFNVPTTADGSPSWYQLEFGAPGSQTIYNLYAESGSQAGGQVMHGITSMVVDRAVQLTVQPESSRAVPSYSFSFAPGASMTYDVANLPPRAFHDINADGYSDLIFQKTDGTVFGWELTVTGSGMPPPVSVLAAGQIGTPDPSWQAKYVADFYGDGGSDILFQNSATSEVYIWKQDGLSIATFGSIGQPGTEWQVKGAGDVNGDGAADIIFQNSSTGDVFGWMQHGLSTNVGGALTIGTPGTEWQVKGVANFFGGSGASDIVLQNTTTGDVNIWQLDGQVNPGGNLVTGISNNKHVGSPGTAWQIKGTGDFNGDGYADIVFQNTNSGDVAIWEQAGFSTILAGTVGTPGTDWQVAGTGDFNGDGMADLAFQNTSTGQIFEWQMNGLSITQGASLGDPGTDWHIV